MSWLSGARTNHQATAYLEMRLFQTQFLMTKQCVAKLF